MIEFHEKGAFVNIDVEATRRMYALIDHGETEDCSCGYCAYFAEHRDEAYAQQFRALIERLGIDAAKENETWSLDDPEWRQYHGNFDFVGTVRLDTPRKPNPGFHPPARDTYDYGFADGPGYPWTQKRAVELGFGPIAHVWFSLWLPLA
jgi:hypothetical protein